MGNPLNPPRSGAGGGKSGLNVKCNGCGHVGPESEFPTGHDFFQHVYISGCPKCANRQSPGDASMRMFGGVRPLEYVREDSPADALTTTIRRSTEAS